MDGMKDESRVAWEEGDAATMAQVGPLEIWVWKSTYRWDICLGDKMIFSMTGSPDIESAKKAAVDAVEAAADSILAAVRAKVTP